MFNKYYFISIRYLCENRYKFVSSFQMSCTASTFMQLPFRKGGNGKESLLSLCRSRPTQPKINFMWEICTYCSSICTLGLLLNSKLSFPKPKWKIIHKSALENDFSTLVPVGSYTECTGVLAMRESIEQFWQSKSHYVVLWRTFYSYK